MGRAPAQQVARGAGSSINFIANSVRLKVQAFKAARGVKMYEEGKDGAKSSRVYLDPLDWRRVSGTEVPHLVSFVRHVLPIPATQP